MQFVIEVMFVEHDTEVTTYPTPHIVESDNAEALLAWIDRVYASQYKVFAKNREVHYSIRTHNPSVISADASGMVPYWVESRFNNTVCSTVWDDRNACKEAIELALYEHDTRLLNTY